MRIDYIELDGILYPKLYFDIPVHLNGKYGRMRMNYLKEYKQETFFLFVIENKLIDYLKELDEQAHQMLELLEQQYLKKNSLPANGDFMETYHLRQQARDFAEEIVLHDLIYCCIIKY